MFEEVITLDKGISDAYRSPLTGLLKEDFVAALDWYINQGWQGCCDYSSPMALAVYAMSFESVGISAEEYKATYSINEMKSIFGLEEDEDLVGFETHEDYAQELAKNSMLAAVDSCDHFPKMIDRSVKKDYIDSIFQNIEEIDLKTYEKNIDQMLGVLHENLAKISGDPGRFPPKELLIGIFKSKDKDSIFSLYFDIVGNMTALKNKYNYFFEYWPQLTIWKENQLRFVEVRKSKRDTKRSTLVKKFCEEVFEPHDFEWGYCYINSSDFVDGRLQTEELNLVQHRPGKWESPVSGDHCRPEIAVFDYFRSNGWSGSYREGDLIFLLLQLMMFKKIPISACDEHHKLNIFNAFENPDNQNWPYNTWGKIENRISNIRKITTSEIGSNFDRLTEKPVMCQGVSEWYDPYREISRKMMEDFSRCFSRDQLVRLAKSLADPRNSYRFSYGWPDLTLYKDGKVIFREVKTENDTLRINQEQLYDEVLGPFGFDTKIINLLPGGSGISP